MRKKNFLWWIWIGGGGVRCALYSRAFVYIVIHWNNLHLFPMQCTSLQSKIKKIYIHSFNAQQFNSLDCSELHCLANCWFAVHCNVLDCTAPPTLHYTALHWVKFEISCYYKIYITLLLCFYEKSRIWETPIFQTILIKATIQKTRHGRPHW